MALRENDMERNAWSAVWRSASVCGLTGVLMLAACNSAPPPNRQESDAQLRQQAAVATEHAKHDARVAAAEARHAAGVAERKMNDIAQGVKEGMGKPAPGRPAQPVNINSASREQLETLPGVGHTTAQSIMDHRPYGDRRDLVSKGAISASEYNRIADDVSVN